MDDPNNGPRRPNLGVFALLALLIALGLTAGVAAASMPTGKVASLPTQPGAPGQVMGGATGDNGPGMADPISAKIMDSPVITCSTVITGAIDGTETQQTGRLFRDDPGTTCEVPTTCEPFDTVPRYYDSYTFVNETGVTACVAIYLENRCGGAQSMQSAAYLGSFNPGNLCANYLGDIGETPNNTYGKQYMVSVPAGATFVVTVNDAGTLLCPEYRLVVAADICGSTTPTPVVPTATPTNTPPVGATGTPVPPTATRTPSTPPPTATPGACQIEFTDVPPTNTFYPFVRCLACKGIIQGYADGTFRPNNPVTRGQIAKIISLSAGFTEPVPTTQQSFEDAPYGSTFWEYIERLYTRGIIGGYQCGINPAEPCVPPENRPYFRPNAGATRGQLVKIASESAGFTDTIPDTQYTFTDVEPGSTFWLYIERLLMNRPSAISGYPCGSPTEPCDSENRPYFRPNNGVTRGQASKIVANTFFPGCNPPRP